MAFNSDEPRDARGRWMSSGTMPIADGRHAKPLLDTSAAGRARALIMHALLAAPALFRRAPGWAMPNWGDGFEELVERWNEASDLDDDVFRDQHLDTSVSLATTRNLRLAALGSATALTSSEMVRAGNYLAAAMRSIGAHDWPGFVRFAAARTADIRIGNLSGEEEPAKPVNAPSHPSKEAPPTQAGIASDPPQKTIDLSKLDYNFGKLFSDSFPSGRSQEHGETLVVDGSGRISAINAGAGLNPNSTNFDPDLKVPDGYRVYGIFHTHPYDKSEGGYVGVSLSGGDAAYLIDSGQQVIIAQSGQTQFMFVRTSDTPPHVDFDTLNKKANSMTGDLMRKGMSFPAATRRVAVEIAKQNGLLYYEGTHGVFRRK